MNKDTSWHLLDCIAMNAAHPDSFSIPSHSATAKLRRGDYVQLVFELDKPTPEKPKGERMWVRIVERMQNDFLGVVDSLPVMIEDIRHDQLVAFCQRDILKIFDESVDVPQSSTGDYNTDNVALSHEHCAGPTTK